MLKKSRYLIFFIVLAITAFIGAFTLAQNIEKFIDTDSDGLNDYQEKEIYHTAPNNPDTDNDTFPDGLEVKNNYSPRHAKLKMVHADSDNDGLNDLWEIRLGSNITVKDSDNDGYSDSTEVYNDYSPIDPKPTKFKKKIVVNIKDLRLAYYFGDILLDNVPVSTGKAKTPTPIGEFSIIAKYPVKNYNIYSNTKWNMHFATKNGLRYYIHGAYWHNKFGIDTVSGGCVNVRYEDMERLYNFTQIGTKVIVQ
ncbi:MAG: L,D-transpeptidase family protein [Candidatus Parcubacteria bacterium]|nr:L,D-transpeptidase family protein [Candidatus Parcubacteria bacterium]